MSVGNQENIFEVIRIAYIAHTHMPIEEKKSVRGHDKVSPYYSHPVGMGMLILEDNQEGPLEDYSLREKLACAAILHDVIEDTKLDEESLVFKMKSMTTFSDEYISEIISLVKNCTIQEGMSSMDEFAELRAHHDKYSDELFYLKLVDKWYNLISPDYFVKKGTIDKYKKFLSFLIGKVENGKFKNSRFVTLAKAFV